MNKLILIVSIFFALYGCSQKKSAEPTSSIEVIDSEVSIEEPSPPLYYLQEEEEIDEKLGEDIESIEAYVTDIYAADGIVYVDIDLVQIRYENIDEKVVVNNNPKIRTYIIDENTLIYSNECKEITPQQMVRDKESLLKDKTIITVGSSRRGKMESINFGCYG